MPCTHGIRVQFSVRPPIQDGSLVVRQRTFNPWCFHLRGFEPHPSYHLDMSGFSSGVERSAWDGEAESSNLSTRTKLTNMRRYA